MTHLARVLFGLVMLVTLILGALLIVPAGLMTVARLIRLAWRQP